MNYVEVIGGTKKQRALAEDVAFWCIEKMMPKMKTLEIEIQLSKLEDDRYGSCMEEDRNRVFHLEISKNCDRDEFITSICHEMIHVKQYARKEISDWNGLDQPKWKNNLISKDCGYWDWPWEKEAYSLEYQFADECWEKNII